MKITKFGHCCLLLEIDGTRVITDPGTFSTSQNEVEEVDAILITHEHFDHYHIDSVKAILAKNPHAVVITNAGVGTLLTKENIPFVLVGDGQQTEIKGVPVSGHGTEHAPIYGDMPKCENTAFFVAEKLFFCGDALFVPNVKVEILALPVAGPWMKISEAIDYARAVKPNVAFPIHDALYKPEIAVAFGRWPSEILSQFGISFVPMNPGDTKEF